MRILVFGKNGQVAQAMATYAEEHGLNVLCLGRSEIDITAREEIEAAVKNFLPDGVINAAAYTNVDQAETDAQAAFQLNAEVSGLIAETCQIAKLPFVHISTDYVFDGQKSEPYNEDDSVNPLSVYGKSKLKGEANVLDTNPNAMIMRTAWVYHETGRNFVKTMLSLAKNRDELAIVSDQLGNPTFATDIAKACVTMLKSSQAAQQKLGGVYHYAGSGFTSWYDFAAEIFSLAKNYGHKVPNILNKITTEEYPTPAPRPMNSRLNCEKFSRVFGVESPPWQESLNSCLQKLLDTSVKEKK